MQLPKSLDTEFCRQSQLLGVQDSHWTGSRVICPKHVDPNSDWDVLCLVGQLPQLGEAYCGAAVPFFESIKVQCDEGVLNLILTVDEPFFKSFKQATNVAAWLNLKDRSDRVKLFRIMLYGTHESPPVGLLVLP